MEEQRRGEKRVSLTATLRVKAGAPADGRAVRNILWPSDILVTTLERGSLTIVPDGETVLKEGDIIFVKGETANSEEYLKNLESTVGELVESDTVQSEPEISSETLPDPPNPQEE